MIASAATKKKKNNTEFHLINNLSSLKDVIFRNVISILCLFSFNSKKLFSHRTSESGS